MTQQNKRIHRSLLTDSWKRFLLQVCSSQSGGCLIRCMDAAQSQKHGYSSELPEGYASQVEEKNWGGVPGTAQASLALPAAGWALVLTCPFRPWVWPWGWRLPPSWVWLHIQELGLAWPLALGPQESRPTSSVLALGWVWLPWLESRQGHTQEWQLRRPASTRPL